MRSHDTDSFRIWVQKLNCFKILSARRFRHNLSADTISKRANSECVCETFKCRSELHTTKTVFMSTSIQHSFLLLLFWGPLSVNFSVINCVNLLPRNHYTFQLNNSGNQSIISILPLCPFFLSHFFIYFLFLPCTMQHTSFWLYENRNGFIVHNTLDH